MADVEVAVNPSDAGAVACNAANGIVGIAVLPAGPGAAAAAAAPGRIRPGGATPGSTPSASAGGHRGRVTPALIAVAADKGAPGVTTTALALAAVWPRPVLLAECDPAGGDLVYRLPGAGGEPPRPAARAAQPGRGRAPRAAAAQVWEHAQKLRGGLDVLLGVTSAEQGAGLDPLWGPVGGVLAGLPQADVIADCGRLGPDGPYYDLLAHAAAVVLVTRPSLGEVVRLRDRAAAVSPAVRQRGGQDGRIGVLVVADHRGFGAALAEVGQALGGRSACSAGSPTSPGAPNCSAASGAASSTSPC